LKALARYVTSTTVVAVSFICTYQGLAQSLSGHVRDEQNQPVPFANIFIRELNSGTATDGNGKYYLTLDAGIYNAVVSCIGYNPTTFQVIIKDKAFIKDVWLTTSSVELNEVVVRTSRRDPAFEIVRRVIDNKEQFIKQVRSYKASVYVKAAEVQEKKKKAQPVQEETTTPSGPPIDLVEMERKKEEALLQSINLVEMRANLNYQYPDKYKEERIAYKAYGRKDGLFVPVFHETDFNFYHNLVHLKGIAEVPVISPFSNTAILSYKYKLEEVLKEDSLVVYKIKVTPRKTGDATCRGYVYVNDSIWNINRLELSLDKGGLRFYDAFTIHQRYTEVSKNYWMADRQEFVYETKSGKTTFKGNTLLVTSDYQKEYPFPDGFFTNEVSVTTREAYKRDSAYWNNARPKPLTREQQKVIAYRDSLQAAHNTKHYLDSMEAKYNKVTVGEVLYNGVGFRSEARKSNMNFSPLLNLLNFEVVGGFRVGPFVSYYRSFENGRMIWASTMLSYGLKNKDFQGNMNFWTRYNPYRLGDASIRIGRNFYSINSFDAYLNQLSISNYILHDHLDLFHRIELVNGLYVSVDLGLHNRKSVSGYDATSVLNEIIDEDDPLYFDDYQALITHTRIAYTPVQKFMSEPNRKVVLGSKWPTFSVSHKRGWYGILTSDVDFDFVDLTIEQNLTIGTLGNSRYTLTAGQFVNTSDLRFIDLKRFRQSDPYLYSDPLHSFQLLDTALSTTDLFLEAHYIHHFNGAMINNIPLIKKTRLRTVAGAGAMWLQASGYRYEELFAGVERVFKLGPRRRLRVGVYCVMAQSNFLPPNADFKISFDIIDTWKREWSY
jgi:hypothetical protein